MFLAFQRFSKTIPLLQQKTVHFSHIHRSTLSTSTTTMAHPFIDSHIHFDMIFSKLRQSLDTFPQWAEQNVFKPTLLDGVQFKCESAVHISCEAHSIEAADMLANFDNIYVAYGMHPHNAKDYTPEVRHSLLIW
jgi:Tat protein secretion system quality control protein TatD with DNase activity